MSHVLPVPKTVKDLFDDLLGRLLINLRHRIVIVKLHALEAELFVNLQLLRELHARPNRRAERIGAFVNVPRTEREPVIAHDLSL